MTGTVKSVKSTSSIFISIAAYRDPELLATLRDCIAMAADPRDLRFCIGWQHSPEDSWDNLDEFQSDTRFDIIDIPHQESKGACWARHQIQQRYHGEDYYLQLDSHHRFSRHWDKKIKKHLANLEAAGHEKPLLSAYLPPYHPTREPAGREAFVYAQKIDRFIPQGVIFLGSHHIPNWKQMRKPFRSRFISAHFLFTRGTFVREVPYDPEMYFHGEESSLAVRAFTHGYDLFSPHRPIIWHEYTRKGKTKHWDDAADWNARNDRSYARYRELFGMDEGQPGEASPPFPLEYGFGTKRSLEDYEKFAGIKFRTRRIHKEAIAGELPPLKSDFESGLTDTIKICIDVHKDSLKEEDYDFWCVAMLNEAGGDDFRQDCDENEIKSLLRASKDDAFIHIWRTYQHDQQPYATRVWPHSKSKGWMECIDQVIHYHGAPSSPPQEPSTNGPALLSANGADQPTISTGRAPEPTIFVQIAAYRDPQLPLTLRDCLANARYPDRLRFCIAHQFDESEDVSEFENGHASGAQFHFIKIPYKETKGVCWARNLVQQRYQGEEYTLQMDSHHRFVKDWDVSLISMIRDLQATGVRKPLLTAYLPSYEIDTDPVGRAQEPWVLRFDRFTPEGVIFFMPDGIPNWQELKLPIPSRFFSAHFAFTLGQHCREVPHDPNYYFHGEEISLAARSFTHGYDLFHPHRLVAWHEYTRKGRIKQWDDDRRWHIRNEASVKRNRCLLGVDGESSDLDFGPYGMGTQRTLADYENYAGIRFRDRAVQEYTISNQLPPNPPAEASAPVWTHPCKHFVTFPCDRAPETDYDFWCVAFHDHNGREIYRHDAEPPEIRRSRIPAESCFRLQRMFNSQVKPSSCVVWPHSASKGWRERISVPV
jgi:hypothetical protein